MGKPLHQPPMDRSAVVDGLTDLSNCMHPPVGEGLGRYIEQAARALGGNEAHLARLLGVSRATLSSWKRREAMPEGYRLWFASTLPEKIVVYGSGEARLATVAAREGFLEFITRADLATISRRPPIPPSTLARRMYGLLALADFVAARLAELADCDSPARVAEVLAWSLASLRGSEATDFA